MTWTAFAILAMFLILPTNPIDQDTKNDFSPYIANAKISQEIARATAKKTTNLLERPNWIELEKPATMQGHNKIWATWTSSRFSLWLSQGKCLACTIIATLYPRQSQELMCDFWPSKSSHYPSCPATLTSPVKVKQNTCKALIAANGTYYLNITENKDDFLEKCCDKH